MAKVRLGKRERQALSVVRDARSLIIREVVNYNLTHDRDPSFLHTKGGSSDSVARLQSRTHQGFRSNLHQGRDKMALAVDDKVIAVTRQHVGRVELKGTWKRSELALPTDHSTLLALDKGHTVPKIEAQDVATHQRPTGDKVKRFTKTK